MYSFTSTSNKFSNLYYQERIRKCYTAIPYLLISYLVIISYYILDDFRVFDSASLTLSRIPSVLLSFILIVLRFTHDEEGYMKNYWIPLYTLTLTSVIYSLYIVTFLTYNQPEYFNSGLYIITTAQLLFFMYSIVPAYTSISIITIGASIFIGSIHYYYGFKTLYDIPNFVSITFASFIFLHLKYQNSFKNFKNVVLLQEEKQKSESLYATTLEQNEELKQQKQIIHQQNLSLTNQNNDIHDSLQYAQRIQNAMLPLPFYSLEKVDEYFTFYAPKHIVSGDFHWFGKTDNAQIIAIGDCTGHGVPGALMSMLGISILDRLVTQEQVDDPSYIIEKMHLRLNTLLQQHSTQNDDGMALSVIRIPLFHDENTITYCGAKSPVFFIKKDTIEFHKGGRYYIGGDISPINKCKNVSIEIEKGMMMYMYSDGFEDQFGGTQDKKYKASQFKAFLQSISDEPTSEQKQLLSSEFFNWKNSSQQENVQVDDVLVSGFRF